MKNKIQRLLFTILLMTTVSVSSTLAISSSKLGEKVYNDTCVACHGEDGKGTIDGVPDLTQAEGRLTKKDVVLINSIKKGLETSASSLSMPAKGGDDEMTDQGAKSVLGYMRQKFGRGKTKRPIK
tara:strand:+ start:4963 stop:5337 length:375 start_codon:yes stop_codon:yes gene_type:complete